MSNHPIGPGTPPAKSPYRGFFIQLLRCALFATILLLIHWQHQRARVAALAENSPGFDLNRVARFFPSAARVQQPEQPGLPWNVLDANGQRVGRVLHTSPVADHVIGYCGPTNVLIALGREGRIAGIALLESYDTRDHVAKVRADERFLNSFAGHTGSELARVESIDAVTGATLTSLAIQESLVLRLTGTRRSLRFAETPNPAELQGLFPAAHRVQPSEVHPSWQRVFDRDDQPLGSILRTSPAADTVVGYQGPSDAFLGFDLQGTVIGLALGRSYDNEPYVTYVREDQYFHEIFNGLRLDDLATLDLGAAEVEGVSGATMTSMAVAEGFVQAASAVEHADHERGIASWLRAVSRRDWTTLLVVVVGVTVGLSRYRGKRWVQWGLSLLVVGYLGLITGDLLSLALVGGWAQHGIAWRHGIGLTVLALAALAVPLTTRHNIYCSHLCPHGVVQRWAHRISPWHVALPRRVSRWLAVVPLALLALGIVIAMRPSSIGLVDLEAFDAWHLGIAGAAAITIAVVGLAASFVSPMAYCRYGCPTGAILKSLRFNARSGQWSRRDWAATGLLALAVSLYFT